MVSRNVKLKALCMSLEDCMLITPSLVLVLIANNLMIVIMWVDSDSEGSSLSLVDLSSLLVSSMINCDICDRIIASGSVFHMVRASPSLNR